jgi:hypothetical protein
VLTPGATNGDRDITSVVSGHRIEPAFKEMGDVVLHQFHLGLGLQKIGDRLIAPGQVPRSGS